VFQLLESKLQGMQSDPQFISDVIKPMKVQHLYDSQVQTLSGKKQSLTWLPIRIFRRGTSKNCFDSCTRKNR